MKVIAIIGVLYNGHISVVKDSRFDPYEGEMSEEGEEENEAAPQKKSKTSCGPKTDRTT